MIHSPSLTVLAEGIVADLPSRIATGPRCAKTMNGEVVCSFIVQTRLGRNNQSPFIARSSDNGITWKQYGPIWPDLQDKVGITGSISRSPNGQLFFYGTLTPIDEPNESKWCANTQGLKANNLIWARSLDNGFTWSAPTVIPMPTPGAAEAPGALCVTRNGTWHACYAPYNTFDPNIAVPRNQIVLLSSSDEGINWRHTAMLRFNDEAATGAEAWVIELADGRLLGTCWNLNQRDGSDLPNAYALSDDGGCTWCSTRSTGIKGQTTSLMPLPDGSALFIYNQRKHGEIGIWIARANPKDHNFGVESNEIVWAARRLSVALSATGHSDWRAFSFGQPSAVLLPDETLLLTLWSSGPSGGSIRFLKMHAPWLAGVPNGRTSLPSPHRMCLATNKHGT